MWKSSFGRCIYDSTSGIKVYQNWLYRWLTIDSSALQTLISRRKPQLPKLNYLIPLGVLARTDPGNICMLGLGGAGMVHYLASHIANYHITAIDNHPDVIQIADQYFMTSTIQNLSIIQEQANAYVQDSQACFKHLIVDLYTAETFPKSCNTLDFFQDCKNRLQEGGYLAVNLANPTEQFSVFQHIKHHFDKSMLTFPVKHCSNVVILAGKGISFEKMINTIEAGMKIKRLEWDSVWGYVAYN